MGKTEGKSKVVDYVSILWRGYILSKACPILEKSVDGMMFPG
jgi:hypothetical protein